MGRVAALSRHPLPCGPASCARRGDPLSRRAHSSHVLLSMCKRSALCAFSVANRGTVYSLLSLTHRQEEALFYTPQQPHAMTLPKDIKRTLMQVRRAFGLWSLEANDGRRWELGACVVCPHAQVVECVSECGVLRALRIELMPVDGLCPARWPVRILSVVGVRGSRSGLRSGPLALRALSSGVGGGAAVLNLSVRLTLSSRLSSPLDKDLVLLRALPEPDNVAACGRAGHSILVWYRPLVLEKKSSSVHKVPASQT